MNGGYESSRAGVVVIGAGQAGFSVCSKLRDLGYKGSLTLVGDESHLPYQRPPLSKAYLLGELTAERILLRPRSFYETREIAVRLDSRVVAIDRQMRAVELADGSRIPYSYVVVATGSRPRRLPATLGGSLDGVYYMRSLADADAIAPEFVAGRRLLVVGGGYIGLEAAAVGAKLGLKVTLLEAAPRILQRVASEGTAAFFRELHNSNGVEIMEGTGIEELVGNGRRVVGARLTDGTIVETDFVVVGIGVLPNQELAADAGVETANGITVDGHCRTSDARIFAVGDCASFPFEDTRIRLESVGNAIDQAEAAASTILGGTETYIAQPWFWSDQFDVKLQIAGLSTHADKVVERPGTGGASSFWYYRADRLIAVDALNEPRVFMVAKRLLEGGRSPSPETIEDPATDLKELLK